MKKNLLLLLVIAMLLSFNLMGCSSKESNAPEAPAKNEIENTVANKAKEIEIIDKPAADAKLDENLTIVQALDMVSFDPVASADVSNWYVIINIYSRLFDANTEAKAYPELVSEYSRNSDTEWVFTIYEGVKTHDGKTINADDVVYSLNRAINSPKASLLFKPVKEITKVDDYTIKVTTDGPYPSLPNALAHQSASIVPIEYAKQAEASGDWTNPIGTGRYKFKSRLIGDNIVVERFDDYYEQDDKALNKSLTFKIIPEGSARTIAVETGQADLNIVFDTVDYDRVLANPDVQLWKHYSQTVWHLGFDNTQEWLNNKLVRQAINFAIDREACLEVGHNGRGNVVFNNATFAPTCLGAVNNPGDKYSYDPEKAKELMKEAGCTGFDTEIVVFRDEAERIAVLCQAYLAEIGINAKVTRIENAVFTSLVADHKAPMYITSWGCYWDPDLFLARRFTKAGFGGVNRDWYENPVLDEMIERGRSTFDEEVRADIYEEIQLFMAEEAPEADLYCNETYALAKQGLKGVEINIEMPCHYWKLHY